MNGSDKDIKKSIGTENFWCVISTAMLVIKVILLTALAGNSFGENDDEPVQQFHDFAYSVKDADGDQHRMEMGEGGRRVVGSYSITHEDGTRRVVEYVADHAGFRAVVKTNEPGTLPISSADARFTAPENASISVVTTAKSNVESGEMVIPESDRRSLSGSDSTGNSKQVLVGDNKPMETLRKYHGATTRSTTIKNATLKESSSNVVNSNILKGGKDIVGYKIIGLGDFGPGVIIFGLDAEKDKLYEGYQKLYISPQQGHHVIVGHKTGQNQKFVSGSSRGDKLTGNDSKSGNQRGRNINPSMWYRSSLPKDNIDGGHLELKGGSDGLILLK